MSIAALDLFANGATSIYSDNTSARSGPSRVPETGTSHISVSDSAGWA